MTRSVRFAPAILVVIGIAVLVVAFIGAALGTDRPGFCSVCHEMRPYNDAWAQGKHSNVWCIDCHVEPGLPARFMHKFSALGEVKAHFLGDTKFPRAKPPKVPASRCTRCHAKLPFTTKSGFPHAAHAKRRTCVECHATVAHQVSAAALTAVGAYSSAGPRSAPHIAGTAFAAIDAGTANLPGHVSVSCTQCHDMAKTGCARCHTPKHKPRGACTTCHKPGPTFAFIHPTEKNCAGCHTPPAQHPVGQCSACHRRVGVSFAFSHPSAGEHSWRSVACVKCHPRTYAAVSCTCHGAAAPSSN